MVKCRKIKTIILKDGKTEAISDTKNFSQLPISCIQDMMVYQIFHIFFSIAQKCFFESLEEVCNCLSTMSQLLPFVDVLFGER